MAEKHAEVHTRAQQTGAVWTTHAATFKVGKLTAAQHATDAGALFTAANTRDLAQDAVDDARTARDNNFTLLSKLGVAFPRAVEGQLEVDDDYHGEVADCRKIEVVSHADAMARARGVVSLVTRVNTARAALVPPLDPITVKHPDGSNTDVPVATLATILANHPGLMQTVQDRVADLNKTRGALNRATTKVDQNNKRWFAAWEGNFPEGSAERDALSQIDTGPTTPAPSALELNPVTPQAGGQFAATYVPGGGAHASTLHLQWKVVGVDLEFGHDTLVVLAGQTVATGAAAGVDVIFRTKAANSQGTTYSAEKTGTAL